MSVEEVTQKTENLNIKDGQSTILSEKKEFELKHPLNTKWTLWYTKPAVDKSESWSDLLRPVTSFETVEEFWAIHNAIPKPQELPFKSDYHLFRNDVRPEWEDPANAKGGKWTFQFKGKTPEIDDLWMRSLLAVIGETIDEEDSEINGVVINVRRNGYKIGLWTKSDAEEPLQRIGSRFKTVLKLGDEAQLEFLPHSTATEKNPKPTIVL